MYLKEQVGDHKADRKPMRTELLAVGAERGNLNGKLLSQRTEDERLRATLAAKTDFFELFNGQMAAKEASLAGERRYFEARLAESKSLPNMALKKMTAHRNQQRDEVDHLSLVRGTLFFQMKKARWELTSARAEIGLLTRQLRTHKRSAGDAERRTNDVQYEVDGARAMVTQLKSR